MPKFIYGIDRSSEQFAVSFPKNHGTWDWTEGQGFYSFASYDEVIEMLIQRGESEEKAVELVADAESEIE